MNSLQIKNENELSSDINIVTAEINSYKEIAGQSIFEIGKRVKHARENIMKSSEWKDYCKEKLNMSAEHARRYIKVYEEFGEKNEYASIGLSKLFSISTLPEDERENRHVVESGEIKKPDEMTSRELEQLKRDIKERDEQINRLKESEQITLKQLENEQSKDPQVVTQKVEVVPEDYHKIKGSYSTAIRNNQELKSEMDNLNKQINKLNQQKNFEEEYSNKEKEVKLLQLDANKSVLSTKIRINEFLQEVSFTSYRRGAIASSSDATKKDLLEGINDLKNYIKEMESAINDTITQ